MTVLADTDHPVTDLHFPAVTICSQGLNMMVSPLNIFLLFIILTQAVERALQKDLDEWVGTGRRKRSSQHEPSVIGQFMEEKFHLREDESIFDVLKALAVPAVDVTRAVATNAIR